MTRSVQRWAFAAVAVVVVAVVILGYAISPWSVRPHGLWVEPPRIESAGGTLQTVLEAAMVSVTVGGATSSRSVYNGAHLGPTMVIRGGDSTIVNVSNQLKEDTNLHFHGAHVTPKGNSDNVYVRIEPTETFQFKVDWPARHPPGLYWYHPHWHGDSEHQVQDGMVGAIIVRGALDELQGVRGLTERLMILTADPGPDPGHPVRLVNSQRHPRLSIRPGEVQRWRILNASANDFVNLAIPGVEMHLIARDGNTMSVPVATRSELMAPGDRIEVLVRGPQRGAYEVTSLPFDEGFVNYAAAPFMTLQSSGLPVVGMRIPSTLLAVEDLRKATIDNTRTLTFSVGGTDKEPQFLIDGKAFDSTRIDQQLTLGATEEWLLENPSPEWHPFHIHVNPFQVVEINGEPVDRKGYDDTIAIPARGRVKIRTRYTDFDGQFVLHCHILFHEDHGMMQVVRIVDPARPDASLRNAEFDEPHRHHITPKPNSKRGRRPDARR
jgi:suppressor of ftsI